MGPAERSRTVMRTAQEDEFRPVEIGSGAPPAATIAAVTSAQAPYRSIAPLSFSTSHLPIFGALPPPFPTGTPLVTPFRPPMAPSPIGAPTGSPFLPMTSPISWLGSPFPALAAPFPPPMARLQTPSLRTGTPTARMAREDRLGPAVPGGCVVCTATIDFALRKHICADLERLLGITGLQSNVYFCDVLCARVARRERIDNPKGQRLIGRLAARGRVGFLKLTFVSGTKCTLLATRVMVSTSRRATPRLYLFVMIIRFRNQYLRASTQWMGWRGPRYFHTR